MSEQEKIAQVLFDKKITNDWVDSLTIAHALLTDLNSANPIEAQNASNFITNILEIEF